MVGCETSLHPSICDFLFNMPTERYISFLLGLQEWLKDPHVQGLVEAELSRRHEALLKEVEGLRASLAAAEERATEQTGKAAFFEELVRFS